VRKQNGTGGVHPRRLETVDREKRMGLANTEGRRGKNESRKAILNIFSEHFLRKVVGYSRQSKTVQRGKKIKQGNALGKSRANDNGVVLSRRNYSMDHVS